MKYLLTSVLIIFLQVACISKEIKTEIVIHATPEKVWQVLTDFDSYPNWNPFIKSLTGQVMPGKKIIVRLEPPNDKARTFKPKVLVFDATKEFRWRGRLLLGGLFDGVHKFEIIDNRDGTVTFKQSEKFKGILVPLFKKKLDTNTKDGFDQMNRKLKELAELK